MTSCTAGRSGPLLMAVLPWLALGCGGVPLPADEASVAPRPQLRAVTAPVGTLDAGLMSLAPASDVALVSLRDASTGACGLWHLSLVSGTWNRLGEPRYRNPLAMAEDASGNILMIDSRPGEAIAELIRGDAATKRWSLGPGVARVAVAHEREAAWWIGGVFGNEGAYSLALRLDHDGSVRAGIPAPVSSWTGLSRAEFTGLVLRNSTVVATNPTTCDVLSWTEPDGPAAVLADYSTVPGFEWACNATFSRTPATEDISDISETRDWPLRLFDVGAELLVMVRRANRGGWSLIAIDSAGATRVRADLPRAMLPHCMNDRWAVTARLDLDAPGAPAHLQVWPTTELLAQYPPLNHAPGSSRLEFDVVRTASLDDAASPHLLVDGTRCVADIIVDITRARAEGLLAPTEYEVVFVQLADLTRASELANGLSSHLALSRRVHVLSAPPPARLERFGSSLYLARPAAPPANHARADR